MKKLPWFRFYTEAIDDEKLGLLAFEDRWHFVALLCLKGKGVLDDEPDAGMLARKVALKLGLTLAELEKVVGRLASMGLIDKSNFQPLAWEKRQMRSDQDNTAAERQRRFRESRKGNALRNADRNADVTRLDTDTDTDTDTEEEGEKEADASSSAAKLPTPAASPSNTEKQKPESQGGEKPASPASKPGKPKLLACPVEKIVGLYHETLPELPGVRVMDAARLKTIREFWSWILATPRPDGTPRASTEAEALAWTQSYMTRARDNDFIMGRVEKSPQHKNWRCTIEYLLGSGGMKKVLEETEVAA